MNVVIPLVAVALIYVLIFVWLAVKYLSQDVANIIKISLLGQQIKDLAMIASYLDETRINRMSNRLDLLVHEVGVLDEQLAWLRDSFHCNNANH